ncbi:hypothetical protein EYF80_059079 [Liparis tanakae]|uniref:Uncharacterized protein n=1 Tax=Liparis tanakae TaxID=230148 RepID=A0A4Z2EP94_9TELE|nr:hypothetical protein EYF80_059079 [Liparis tanakae]
MTFNTIPVPSSTVSWVCTVCRSSSWSQLQRRLFSLCGSIIPLKTTSTEPRASRASRSLDLQTSRPLDHIHRTHSSRPLDLIHRTHRSNMQSSGKSLKEALLLARSEERLTAGVYESAKIMTE